ncbi:PEBP-like protein [Hymenopellis radicata]|nr:PEBP-like protein [Hymenopellis radicata]
MTLAVADPLPRGASSHRELWKVKHAFEQSHIPEALTINFNPSYLVEVSFPQAGGPPVGFDIGEQVPINSTGTTPTFSLSGGHFGEGPFVVAAVDPDAPSPQNTSLASVRHFLGGNFTPLDDAFLANSTSAVSEWVQPAPPAGSDPHRYVFLVFNQPEGFNDQTLVNASTSILGFNISSFAEEVGLGDPIAGTYMIVGLNK